MQSYPDQRGRYYYIIFSAKPPAGPCKGDKQVKRCPICETQYSDEAEYCLKCKTLLISQEEKHAQKQKPKINLKGLIIAIAATFAFIGLMMFLYRLLANAR